MSHSTHYRSFRRRFYRSDDPTNSVIALKDDSLPGQGSIPQAQHTKGKEKDVIKKFPTHSTKYTEDTKVLGRQLSQARSKIALLVHPIFTLHQVRGQSIAVNVSICMSARIYENTGTRPNVTNCTFYL